MFLRITVIQFGRHVKTCRASWLENRIRMDNYTSVLRNCHICPPQCRVWPAFIVQERKGKCRMTPISLMTVEL